MKLVDYIRVLETKGEVQSGKLTSWQGNLPDFFEMGLLSSLGLLGLLGLLSSLGLLGSSH
jgi:hypothetical protein